MPLAQRQAIYDDIFAQKDSLDSCRQEATTVIDAQGQPPALSDPVPRVIAEIVDFHIKFAFET